MSIGGHPPCAGAHATWYRNGLLVQSMTATKHAEHTLNPITSPDEHAVDFPVHSTPSMTAWFLLWTPPVRIRINHFGAHSRNLFAAGGAALVGYIKLTLQLGDLGTKPVDLAVVGCHSFDLTRQVVSAALN
eukprot:Opistho-2@48237